MDKVHPCSRKAVQLDRIILRRDKLQKQLQTRRTSLTTPKIERYLWFKFAVDPDVKDVSVDTMHGLMQLYLTRFDEELTAIKQETAMHGRNSKAARQNKLEMQLKQDAQMYNDSGFEVPDYRCAKTLKYMREQWEGDINSIQLIKTVSLKKPETQ